MADILYKDGYQIKPKRTLPTGTVLFTDGTNEVVPNQDACEAYGYKYNQETGVCYAFKTNRSVIFKEQNASNQLIGVQFETNNTENSLLVGQKHITNNFNRNSVAFGDTHIIDNNVINSSVLSGRAGKSLYRGEAVFAGGGSTTTPGMYQQSKTHLSGKVTSNEDVSLYLQGNTNAAEQILLPANSICIYELYVTALCIGGSSGTVGHYKTEKHLGSCLTNNAGAITKVSSSVTAISSNGTTGTFSIDVATAYTMSLQVAGSTNVNCQWSVVADLYVNNTDSVTF